MKDLTSTYMGLKLCSPIVVSACPLSEQVDNIVQMEDAGAGAVVLFSLFEEQLWQEMATYEAVLDATSNTFAEALDYFPGLEDYRVGPDRYLEIIRQAKERVDIPIIASLNGVTDEGWIDYAQQMEAAGADAVMTASSLYQHGINHLATITQGVGEWMGMLDFQSVSQFKGLMSQQNTIDPSAFERANYIRILENSK
jgi:dihydroorotate dehydrogenase